MAEKNEKTPSQSQQTVAFGAEAFAKATEEQTLRMNQYMDEMGKAHSRFIQYGNTQIDEMAELVKASFNNMNALSTEFRKVMLDSMKQSTQLFSNR